MMTLCRAPLAIDMNGAWQIGILEREHIPAVAELERLCFSEPWSENSLAILTAENNFGVVATLDGRAVAYGGMTCVLDEGAVTNIATHPDLRRRGLGREILRALLSEARKRGARTVFLEVRESNEAARALYLSEGFYECGIRKNFYRHPTENAVQMAFSQEEE